MPWTLITGGSSGIGRECVRLLVEQGKRVLFTYRSDKARAEALVQELKSKHPDCELITAHLDLGIQSGIFDFVNQLRSKNYRFNSIVHSAGVGTATIKDQAGEQDEDFRFVAINGIAPLKLQEALDPFLVGDEPGTGIVFVGSVGGGDRPFFEFSPGDPASKAYLDFRVKDLAMRNLRTHRHIIRVNPGATDTSMFQKSTLNKMDSVTRTRFEESLPKKRVFSPTLVAEAIVFHVDPRRVMLYHGASISLSGGLHLSYAPLSHPAGNS